MAEPIPANERYLGDENRRGLVGIGVLIDSAVRTFHPRAADFYVVVNPTNPPDDVELVYPPEDEDGDA